MCAYLNFTSPNTRYLRNIPRITQPYRLLHTHILHISSLPFSSSPPSFSSDIYSSIPFLIHLSLLRLCLNTDLHSSISQDSTSLTLPASFQPNPHFPLLSSSTSISPGVAFHLFSSIEEDNPIFRTRTPHSLYLLHSITVATPPSPRD